MKKIFNILLLTVLVLACQGAFSQGWRARLELNFGSGSTPLATVDNATISFSGTTRYGWSANSNLTLDLTGSGSPSGPLYVFASGRSALNYEEIAYVTITYEGPFEANCNNYYLDLYGTENEHLAGIFTLYPRLEISHYTEDCNQITLTTDVCAPRYTWEVSENLAGPFKVLMNTQASGLTLSGDDLASLGLSKYGQKYFRVTGLAGTTSPVVPAYLFAPGPGADFALRSPTCHDGNDGAIGIKILSAYPGIIDDFVVTVTGEDGSAPMQLFPNNTDEILVPGLSATKYLITIENNTNVVAYGACMSSFTVGPIVNPDKVQLSSIEISDYNGFAISCKGGGDGFIKVTPSGGSGAYSAFEWTPAVSSTDMAINLLAGSYSVRVRDSRGCDSDEYTRVLTEPGEVAVDIHSTGGKNGYGVSCHDSSDGKITAIATGGVSWYSYTWSGGTTAATLTALSTGTYQVTVSDGNGCTASASVVLEAPKPIDFDLHQLSVIRCAGDETAALEVASVQNTIGTVFYQWSTGDTGPSVTGIGAGNFEVTLSDDQGCSRTKNISLHDPPAYTVDLVALSDFNGSPIRCSGESSGSIGAAVKDESGEAATAAYYKWYKGDAEIVSGSGQPLLEAIGAGTYTVNIEYGEGCASSSTIDLSEPAPLQGTIRTLTNYHGFPVSCNGATDGQLLANSSGGTGDHTYLWENGATENTRLDVGAGKYTVTVRDGNGCETNAETILSGPHSVQAQILIISDFNGTPVSCTESTDGHVRGTAQGGASSFSYLWSTGADTTDLTSLSAGTYSLTATDINGCSAYREITLLAPPPVAVSIIGKSDYNGFGVSCYEGEDGYLHAEASGGTGSHRYKWLDTSHSDPYYNHLPAGIYTVSVTDQNGCTGSISEELSAPEALTSHIAGSKDISCSEGHDGEIELAASGGAGGYTYSSNGESWQEEPKLTGIEANDYVVLVADLNGCKQSILHTLREPSPLSIAFTDMQAALCGQARGGVSSLVTGGTGAYAYHWASTEGNLPAHSSDIADLLPGVYTLRVTDEHSCQATASVGISATDGPQLKMTALQQPTCADSKDGSASVEVVDGDGPYQFLWHNGQMTFAAEGLDQGIHLVEVRDANNCLTTGEVVLRAPAPLEVELLEQTDPLCHGDCNGSIKVAATGGNGEYVYAWQSSAGPEITGLCGGEHRLKVTDKKGCTVEEVFLLRQPDALTIMTRAAAAPSCRGSCDGSLRLQALGGTGTLHYLWSTGDTAPEILDLCQGTYTLTVTDENQCSAQTQHSLADPEDESLDLGGSTTICGGQSIALDAGAHWKSQVWGSNTGFTSTTQQVSLTSGGTYWITVTTHNGCLVRDTFLLKTSDELLTANFLVATEASTRDTLVVIDISWPMPNKSTWTFPDEMIVLEDRGETVYGRFDQQGSYTISLLATLGDCRDAATKTVTIVNEKENPSESGRLGNESFVTKFNLYPNPNDGAFDLEIDFAEPGPVLLTVWNTLTASPVVVMEDAGSKTYRKHFDLRPLSAGNYTLRMDYETGTRYVRFIVR